MMADPVEAIEKHRLSFEDIERAVWLAAIDTFRRLMVKVLEGSNAKLTFEWDLARYESKGLDHRLDERPGLEGKAGRPHRHRWGRTWRVPDSAGCATLCPATGPTALRCA